jgi:RimJ/RimL family protein N-acetyltransferase
MDPVTLGTDRLLLEMPVDHDIDDITSYCQDPLFERYLTTPWPYERRDAESFVQDLVPRRWASGDEFTWAIRRAGGSALVGVIGFRTGASEIGFWMGEPHRGAGVMTEAVGAVADWLFALGTAEIRWECLEGNIGSATVAHRSGFEFTGSTPSRLPIRDGTRPPSWTGRLYAGARSIQSGWPV